MSDQEPIILQNWEAFENKIKEERSECEKLKKKENSTFVDDLLFRGQRNAEWKLLTSLERFSKNEWSCNQYYKILQKVEPTIASLTSNKYELPENFIYGGFGKELPGLELMIYLRHHGFPSPLLDWTVSPYVAAFFAFNEAKENDEIAIYTFREYLGNGKNSSPNEPFIWGLGPYIRTHKRHYQQQSRYTFSIKKKKLSNDNHIYGNHESVNYGNDQDLLKKYIIPGKERNKVLEKLDHMNINAFSLFSDEEGLMNMLAYREIKKKESHSIEG